MQDPADCHIKITGTIKKIKANKRQRGGKINEKDFLRQMWKGNENFSSMP
jgi:hypothetical protein